MQKIFFTADTHFGHENVIQFDKRPFASADEMDEEMIKRWNNKVGKGDLVYVLGDMIWKSITDYAEPLIKSLNGQIILIKGNHDQFINNGKAKIEIALAKGKKTYTLTGSITDKKFLAESLTYNYRGKDAKTGESKRLYGRIINK